MTKQTYEVTGQTPFGGHQPGSTFTADLDPEQEARAVERGAIKPVKKTKEEVSDDA
jgi:hypothetical protein